MRRIFCWEDEFRVIEKSLYVNGGSKRPPYGCGECNYYKTVNKLCLYSIWKIWVFHVLHISNRVFNMKCFTE